MADGDQELDIRSLKARVSVLENIMAYLMPGSAGRKSTSGTGIGRRY